MFDGQLGLCGATRAVNVPAMKAGYQGEPDSYSYRVAGELLPDAERVGFASFAAAFHALADKDVDRLVLPIENSTTGSVLPVLDRLVAAPASIIAESVLEVRHALLGVAGSDVGDCQIFYVNNIRQKQVVDMAAMTGHIYQLMRQCGLFQYIQVIAVDSGIKSAPKVAQQSQHYFDG